MEPSLGTQSHRDRNLEQEGTFGGSLVGYCGTPEGGRSLGDLSSIGIITNQLEAEQAQLGFCLPFSKVVKKRPRFLASKPDCNFLDNLGIL